MSDGASRELRDRAHAEAWLAAGLCLARLSRPGAEEHARMAPWLLGVLSESGTLPPAGVIADIAHLLLGRSMRAIQPLPDIDARLGQVIHAYEDHVLGRLDADPRLDAVLDAITRLPPVHHDRAVVLFSTHILLRMGHDTGVALSPGVVRRVLRLPVDEVCGKGLAAMTGVSEIFEALVAGYQSLITGARRLGTLIGEAEVFLMENLEALGELTQRIAIEQMIDVMDALSATLPRRLKPAGRHERERIPTPLAAEDQYPTGGFAALSTAGSLENLVASELIYMEERGAESDIDLFDLRYAEGELLYYTRDESVFVRGRRVITLAFMPDLESVRFKDASLSWQRLVMALGLMMACVHRLAEWLAGEGLLFRVVFVREPGHAAGDPLAAERSLCGLALRELVARGVVDMAPALELGTLMQETREHARWARASVLVISADRVDIEPVPGALVGRLCLADAEPALDWLDSAGPPGTDAGAEADPWASWARVLLDILQALL